MSSHATNNPCVTCNVITAPISKVSVRIQLVNAEHSGKCPEDSPQQMHAIVIIYQFIPKVQCLIQPCWCIIWNLCHLAQLTFPSFSYTPFHQKKKEQRTKLRGKKCGEKRGGPQKGDNEGQVR